MLYQLSYAPGNYLLVPSGAAKSLVFVSSGRLERPTYGFEARRSIQLSYEPWQSRRAYLGYRSPDCQAHGRKTHGA